MFTVLRPLVATPDPPPGRLLRSDPAAEEEEEEEGGGATSDARVDTESGTVSSWVVLSGMSTHCHARTRLVGDPGLVTQQGVKGHAEGETEHSRKEHTGEGRTECVCVKGACLPRFLNSSTQMHVPSPPTHART